MDSQLDAPIRWSQRVPAAVALTREVAVDLLADERCQFATRLTDKRYQDRADELLGGRLLLKPHRAVDVGHPPDWTADPFGDSNWRFQLHALRWAQALKRSWDDNRQPAVLDRYLAILHDWWQRNPWDDPASDQSWSDHSTALRARVYAACGQAFGGAPRLPRWLRLALDDHVDVLAGPDLYPSGGNHALNQNVGLFAAATVVGRDDERLHAIDRTAELLERSVDEQGVTDEQSSEYQTYNYRRYREAIELFTAAGQHLPAVFERVERMTTLMAYLTDPAGRRVMIGDSCDDPAYFVPGTAAGFAIGLASADHDLTGEPPIGRWQVFDRGYVTARSGWGQHRPAHAETHLTVRFGPARIPHGHHDAGTVTWHAHGQRILMNAGKHAYRWDNFRRYVLSRHAQNVVTFPDVAYGPDGGSRLVGADEHAGLLTVTIEDDHYPDVALRRTVICPLGDPEHAGYPPSWLVVADAFAHADGQPVTAQQRLRFDPSFSVEPTAADTTLIGNGIAVEATSLTACDATQLVCGSTEPADGWVSLRYGEATPTNVLVTSRHAPAATIVTLLQAWPVDRSKDAPEPARYVATFDGETLTVRLTGAGRDEPRWQCSISQPSR